MPTSARWEAANLPQISVKPVHSAGGQSRPPLQERAGGRRRGRRLCRPKKYNEFAENSRKTGAICAGRGWHRPRPWNVVGHTGVHRSMLFAPACCNPSGAARQLPFQGSRYSAVSSAAVSGSCISSKAFWASSKITCTSANASCRRERPVDRSAASAAISSPESM